MNVKKRWTQDTSCHRICLLNQLLPGATAWDCCRGRSGPSPATHPAPMVEVGGWHRGAECGGQPPCESPYAWSPFWSGPFSSVWTQSLCLRGAGPAHQGSVSINGLVCRQFLTISLSICESSLPRQNVSRRIHRVIQKDNPHDQPISSARCFIACATTSVRISASTGLVT